MLPVPEELGGLGGTLLDFVKCQERLAQGCASTALSINMHIFALGSTSPTWRSSSQPHACCKCGDPHPMLPKQALPSGQTGVASSSLVSRCDRCSAQIPQLNGVPASIILRRSPRIMSGVEEKTASLAAPG